MRGKERGRERERERERWREGAKHEERGDREKIV